MNDFDTRVTEALQSGAEDAPAADRLAARARTRARTRRTRTALVSVGAVVALAVPVAVVALTGGDDPRPDDPVASDPPVAPAGWRTVEHGGVLVDVPASWTCQTGEQGTEGCTHGDDWLAFYGSATFDPARGPGLVELPDKAYGYVTTGDWAVSVQAGSARQARRILGSARVEGQDAPDLSAGFRTVTDGGLSIEVPRSWQDGGLGAWCLDEEVPGWVQKSDTMVPLVDCGRLGYGVAFDTGDQDDHIRERDEPTYPEGSWAGVAVTPGADGKPAGFVQVVAPTQGLAELIGGSLRVE